MITVKTLKQLIENLPDNAEVYAYEGEDTGFVILKGKKYWFIRATESRDTEDTHTEGFER